MDPGQFRRDTAPPVIRLKLGAEVSKWLGAEVSNGHFGSVHWTLWHQFYDAEVSFGRSVRLPDIGLHTAIKFG